MAKPERTLETFGRIVDHLAERGSVGVRELATEMDRPVSTIHGYLQAMAEQGWVVNEDGSYRLSCRFLRTGSDSKHAFELYDAANVPLETLGVETGCTVYVAIEEQGYVVVIEKRKRHTGGWGPAEGTYADIKQTATGKAILAHGSDELFEQAFAEGYFDVFSSVYRPDWAEGIRPVSREKLSDDLEQIRRRGYAKAGLNPGSWSLAAPILGANGDPLGAVGMAAKIADIDDEFYENTAPEYVMEAAEAIEAALEE